MKPGGAHGEQTLPARDQGGALKGARHRKIRLDEGEGNARILHRYLQPPNAAQTASMRRMPAKPRRPKSGSPAMKTVSKVRPCTLNKAAGWIKISPSAPGITQSVPQKFQGKPEKANCWSR